MSTRINQKILPTDDGRVSISFLDFHTAERVESYFTYKSNEAVFAVKNNRTIRSLLEKPVFIKGTEIWKNGQSSTN